MPLTPPSEPRWNIRVDTGGTFTDCIARAPSGKVYRLKLLSSGRLRLAVVGRPAADAIRIELPDEYSPEALVGMTLRLCDDNAPQTRDRSVTSQNQAARIIVEVDAARGVLRLDGPLPESGARSCELSVAGEEAPILCARLLTGTSPPTAKRSDANRQGQPCRRALPPLNLRIATTRATNALLERRRAETAFFVTRGFADLLDIGTQQRPELFSLRIEKPAPLHAHTVEVDERLSARGEILRPLNVEALHRAARELADRGVRTAAVALLHADRYPDHERRAAAILREAGFTHVSCSSELAPFIGLLSRAQTAVIDACLNPIIHAYLGAIAAALGEADEAGEASRIHIMTSAGGLTTPVAFHAKDSLMSGPAGGIAGAAAAGRRSGLTRVISFDMGGTSTDVARYDDGFDYAFELDIAGARMLAPLLAIESIAAGGGSVCWFDGERLRVGPRSAGADPGPACYGAGGPLTLTDVNLLLGRLDPERLPIPIDAEPARARLDELLEKMALRGARDTNREETLTGLVEIANEHMAAAIAKVSLRKGYDPAEYALVAFGGAGGLHACGVARRLGMTTVIIPRDAGLLSAAGLDQADIERFAARGVMKPLDVFLPELDAALAALARQALDALESEGAAAASCRVKRRLLNLRLAGQDTPLTLDYPGAHAVKGAFRQRYTELYGYWPEDRVVEIESLRIIASATDEARAPEMDPPNEGEWTPHRSVRACLDGAWREIPVYERVRLERCNSLRGPALVLEDHCTTFVDQGWAFAVDDAGAMRLTDTSAISSSSAAGSGDPERARPESVRLELFTNRFRSIAEDMGEMLCRCALSTNIKERRDFSCALLDAAGELVVNAPHVPVHLGALGVCVRAVARDTRLRPGDTVVTNHPAFGGSHLPDVTLISPVFTADGTLVGYAANRAHHAEIGGIRPGSMPADALNLAEEGVVIPPTLLVAGGAPQWEAIRSLLLSAPWPTRAVEDNLADLNAALAANRFGVDALLGLVGRHGLADVLHYMEALKAHAAARLQAALRRFGSGRFSAEEFMDDGTRLAAAITFDAGRCVIDFSGSAPAHRGNLNATPAIVRGVVLYVLRTMIDAPLPLNEGLMRDVELIVPDDSILSPRFPDDPARAPAVVGGNVETSQRLVDTMLKALGLSACSYGSMNNLAFGGEGFSYYETLGGGGGAGADFDGADAVQCHMTNTRITDAEIIEHRYPVRVERFAIRRGSGGAGARRGGDGLIRDIVFLAPAELSLLTEHRIVTPYGMDGGRPGAVGRQHLIHPDGVVEELPHIVSRKVAPGDRLVLETPGGGGCGKSTMNIGYSGISASTSCARSVNDSCQPR